MATGISRRRWLQLAGGVGIAGLAGGGWQLARRRTVRIGLIGAGSRADSLANSITSTRWLTLNGRIVAVCDADRLRANDFRARHTLVADVTQDFHEVLSRDDIDAVCIATPDHWHVPLSMAALRAGKHVYCEKPMTLTIPEGQQLKAAVQASGRTFLVGTQQRSDSRFQLACTLVRNGRLGALRRITITLPENRAGGPFAAAPVPPTLDWERWLGPAPRVDYCPERFLHYRPWYEYSGGSLTDWGAHHIDIAHWAMGLEESGPIEISGEGKVPRIENGYNTPPQFHADLKYANGVTVHLQTASKSEGLLFEGDAGRLFVNRGRITGTPVEQLAKNPLPADAIHAGHRRHYFGTLLFAHIQHFLDCVANGATPISDVASQHRSITACHLGNIALRLQRTIRWDPATEAFIADAAATALSDRVARPI